MRITINKTIALSAIATALCAPAAVLAQAASSLQGILSAHQTTLETMAKAAGVEPQASATLMSHQSKFKLALRDITPHVTVREGEYSVYSFVRTSEGIVAVDAGFLVNTTQQAFDEYQTKTGHQPLRAVIYTHSHGDHTYGTEALLGGVPDRTALSVYGPKGWERNLSYESSPFTPVILRKGFEQLGTLLPANMAGSVGTALGGPVTLGKTAEGLKVNKEIREPKETHKIGGLEFEFLNAAGDIAENVAIYLKQDKVLFIGDILDGTFLPFQTARWEPGRTIAGYQRSIEALQANFPDAEVLVAGHGVLTMGRDHVRQRLQNARDLAKYVDDYTTRAALLGWSPDQVVTSFQLPERLAHDPDLQGYYHRIDWILRGAYITKNGWVSDINALTRWPDAIEQPRTLALMGGRERVMKEATKALRANDPRWAGALANLILQVHPGDGPARQLQKQALLKIAYGTMSANERNYALSNVLDIPWNKLLVPVLQTKISRLSAQEALSQWSVRVRHADARGTTLSLPVSVGEERFVLTLREGILDVASSTEPVSASSIRISRQVLDRIGAGALSLREAINGGYVVLEGNPEAAKTLADLM